MKRALAAVLIVASHNAFAAGGRPMTTDDAALTNRHSCQMETWLQHARGDTQLWLLPACNPWDHFEVSVGSIVDFPQGASGSTGLVVQGKAQWLDRSPLQVGIAAGTQRAHDSLNLDYAYVPMTMSVTSSTQVHVNLGWQHDRIAREDQFTYAAALAHDLSRDLNAFAEIVGSDSAAPIAQAGGAVLFRGGVIQLDASFGRPVHGTWRDFIYSIGFELYPDALW